MASEVQLEQKGREPDLEHLYNKTLMPIYWIEGEEMYLVHIHMAVDTSWS